jgi:hypothetical protein
MNEREQWLSNLKVGDEVALASDPWSGQGKSYSLYTVQYITTSRNRFDLAEKGGERGISVNKHGLIPPPPRSYRSGDEMVPVTQEILNAIEHEKACARAVMLLSQLRQRVNWRKLSVSQIDTLSATLEGVLASGT